MKKVMLLAAMLAMVLAAAVPALAQSVTQVGSDNEACVQTAVQTEVGKVQISQYGDNVNIQAISQQCNVTVEQVSSVVASVSSASASASASASPAAAQYQYKAPAAAQYQYSSPSASASASAAAELPETGGSSLIALGAGVLLVAGGLVARRIVR